MSMKDRNRIYAKQQKVIKAGKARGLKTNVPISQVQWGAPTLEDLERCIYPDFEPSMDAFLEHFAIDWSGK